MKSKFSFFFIVFRSKRKLRKLFPFRVFFFYVRTKHAKAKSKTTTIFPTAINIKSQNLLVLLLLSKDANLQETAP